MTDCATCQGTGFVLREMRQPGLMGETHDWVACQCLQLKRIRQWIDQHPDLVGASRAKDPSPLVASVPRLEPLDGNVILHGHWDWVREHIVYWLAASCLRGKWPRIKIMGGEAVKEAYVDNELDAALGGLDLLIVRVGNLRNAIYGQVYAAALEKVQRVWFVTQFKPLKKGHHAWTEELAPMIEGWPFHDFGSPDKRDPKSRLGIGEP